jgi:hypothetical protein
MANKKTTGYPGEGARTPGSAEGERNTADQNDRMDEDVVGMADDDDIDEADDDEDEEDEDDFDEGDEEEEEEEDEDEV